MKKHKNSGWWVVLIILLLLIIDQILKVWVKTHMQLGESIRITDWFYILFIENPGMAYGMTFINKIVLSLSRIVAVSVIGYYIYKVMKREYRTGYLVCLAMIFAGATGNIFDSLFYGQIFTVSTPYNVSEVVPFGQGYAPMLQGKVVDMFYFPLIVTTWPEWVPVLGGRDFVFFSPIFNLADSYISVAFVLLLLFFRNELEHIYEVLVEGTRFEKKKIEDDGEAS